jgi:hypothetical protein
MMLSAPVGQVYLVHLDAELIALNAQISHMLPGICHATIIISDVSERIDSIEYVNEPENRPRFAALAVLYGWVGTISDRQFIYSNSPPRFVHSVDHGHFFPGGPDWSPASLAAAPACVPDDALVTTCRLSQAELALPLAKLRAVTPAMIEQIVAVPPAAWGVSDEDRSALLAYLDQRRTALAAL